MSSKVAAEVETQRKYYSGSAHLYNEMHNREDHEHYFALSVMAGIADYFGIKSILDIGSGTGRAVAYVKRRCPEIRMVGIEPVPEMRAIGYSRGISHDDLIEGNALNLQFHDGEFDMVCEFGVLHHVKTPKIVVAEMLRVAKKVVFISDSNNFGQGSVASRSFKQLLRMIGLWKIANVIKTRGKGYTFSAGDGLAYSYSAFSNFEQIRRECICIHSVNTSKGGINPYRTASHVALIGVKR